MPVECKQDQAKILSVNKVCLRHLFVVTPLKKNVLNVLKQIGKYTVNILLFVIDKQRLYL